MPFQSRHHFFIFGVALALTSSAPYASADAMAPGSIVLHAPCADAPNSQSAVTTNVAQLGLPSCQAFLNGNSTDHKVASMGAIGLSVASGFNDLLQQRVKTGIENLYTGTNAIGTGVCNLVTGPFNPTSETASNHDGASCGTPMYIQIKTSPLTLVFHKDSYGGHPNGTLEDHYLAGGNAAAVSCFYNQVSSEIKSSSTLTVKNYVSDTPSYCAQMASDYQKLADQHAKTMQLIFGRPGVSLDRNKVEQVFLDCNSVLSGQVPTNVGLSTSLITQVCSARAAMDKMFLSVASCEVFGRASDSYLRQVGSADAQTKMLKWIRDTMQNQCLSAQSEGEANKCYQQKIAPTIQNYLNGLWPANGSCNAGAAGTRAPASQGSRSMPFLAIGMILPGWPKRRRHGAKAKARSLASAVAITAIAAAACNQVTSSTPNELATGGGCQDGNNRSYPGYCCPAGAYNSAAAGPNGESCTDSSLANQKQLSEDMNSGATNSNIASTNLGNANTLLGSTSSDYVGKPTQDQGAATAGTATNVAENTQGGDTVTSAGSTPSNVGDNVATPQNTLGQGSGTNALSPMAGLGTTSGAGSTTNATGSGATAGASKEAITAANGKAQYQGEGQGAGGGATGKGSADGLVDGTLGGLLGAGQGLAGGHGADSDPDHHGFNGEGGMNPMGSKDPEDYFTRMNLSDNLFQIVTKRYRTKALAWAEAQAQAGPRSSAKTAAVQKSLAK